MPNFNNLEVVRCIQNFASTDMELDPDRICRKFRQTAADGKRRKIDKQITDDEDLIVLKELQAIAQSTEAHAKR
jgi:hypothetical protein